MVQITWPLADQELDQEVTEAQWSNHFRQVARSGVLGQPGTSSLRVLRGGTNREVLVEPGRGTLHGFAFESSSTERFNLAANNSGTARVDLIVMRYDAARPPETRIRLAVLQGTPGGGAPALSRAPLLYDIRLGTVTVAANAATILEGQLADTREFSAAPVVPTNQLEDVEGFRVPSGGIVTFPTEQQYMGAWAFVQTAQGLRPIVEAPKPFNFTPRLLAAQSGELGYGRGGAARGWYLIRYDDLCDIEITFDFGENPYGGVGPWQVPLPAGLSNRHSSWTYLDCVQYSAQQQNHYVGKAALAPGSSLFEILMPRGDKPYVQNNVEVLRQVAWLSQARNENGTTAAPGGPGTAVPEITPGAGGPRQYPIQNGSRLAISGRFRLA